MLPLQAESLSVIEEFVRGQLKQIRTNIEIGSDNISARLLTDSANVISKSPTKLFNRSLVTLIFPSLNMEEGDHCDPNNYRPITVEQVSREGGT